MAENACVTAVNAVNSAVPYAWLLIPQIVEQLGQGDPRWNPFRAQQKVMVTVLGGDCS